MSDNEINESVVRSVIASLGFPQERVEKAVACLVARAADTGDGVRSMRILSSREVQQMLSISPSSLSRLVSSGKLKPVDLTARRIGFIEEDVQNFILSHKRTS